MARYERETKHYDRRVLTHLVETGQAQYYPAQGGIYVLKTEDGTVAVRAHQIVETTLTDVAVIPADPSPMEGYYGQERYDGEDTGPGGVVYDGALALAQEYVAQFSLDTDPLVYVRRILDDEDGEYAHALRESIDDDRRPAAPARVERLRNQDDLLRHFGL